MRDKLCDLQECTELADWIDAEGFASMKCKFVHLFLNADTSVKVTDVKWRAEWAGVSESEFRAHCEIIRQAGLETVDMTFAEYDPASVREA